MVRQAPAIDPHGLRGAGALLRRLIAAGPPVASTAPHLFQGLKTSADKLYLVTAGSSVDGVVEATNGFGEQFAIEEGILQPALKGEHVQRYAVDASQRLNIIYPYTVSEAGRAVLRSARELEEKTPLAWEYLQGHRAKLGARDKGKWARRADWYAYARSQNIGAFREPKFLVPYMTQRLRAAWDQGAGYVLVNITTGGYGLRFASAGLNTGVLSALLNSRLWTFCIRQLTSSFRGGYFAVNKQAIERLPLPSGGLTSDSSDALIRLERLARDRTRVGLDRAIVSASGASTVAASEAKALDAAIDRAVYSLYGLTAAEIHVVTEETAD